MASPPGIAAPFSSADSAATSVGGAVVTIGAPASVLSESTSPKVVPLAFAAFEDYRMGGVTLSSKAIAVLKRRLAGETVTQEASGMSKGEWREFVEVWG